MAKTNAKTGAKKDESPSVRRRTNMGRPIAAALAPLLAKPAAKRGFRDARLMAEWGSIVGKDLAGRTRPEKLDRRGENGTLRLVVAPGWAVEVQHLEPLIIQRVNQFFGAAVVTRLKLKQGPVMAPVAKKAPLARAAPSPETEAALAEACAKVEDKELAEILQRLGRSVLG